MSSGSYIVFLLCFAAQQRCCQCYQYIHGRHYSRPDAASCISKLIDVNSRYLPYRRLTHLRTYCLFLLAQICHLIGKARRIDDLHKCSYRMPLTVVTYSFLLLLENKRKEKDFQYYLNVISAVDLKLAIPFYFL